MKAGQYVVSVQWGAGYHYFVGSADSLPRAQEIASVEARRLAKRRKMKGAKPLVFVWMQRMRINPDVISK